MQARQEMEAELARLAQGVPADYYHGVRAAQLCQPDNLIAFVRAERRVLHDSGFTTRPHHRYVLLINYATAGTVSVDGVAYRLHPGDAFLIAPFQLHFYLDVVEASIRWLFFTFEAPERGPFEPFLNSRLGLSEEELGDAVRLAADFQRVELAGAGAREALLLGFAVFLNRLRQAGLRRAHLAVYPAQGYTLLDRVNRLLAWHLDERLTVEALARRLAMSPSHLRKRFQQLNGLSLGSYLLHYRLNRAIKLLVQSDLSLTQIAVECGYESLAAFSRAFKGKVGKTPSEFRKSGQ